MAAPVTVEILAGMPDPISGPAVGAIELVTSMVWSLVTRVVSRRRVSLAVLSGC
jgi:hypothetical protein